MCLFKTIKEWVLDHLLSLMPDKIYLKLKYRVVMHKKLDLKNPKTFNEKLQWLKLYNRKPEYTTMVDKYAVKEYVASKIGEEFIIPTLGVWNNPEDVDWDSLPNQFVLKTTHGGGNLGVVVVKNKSSIDRELISQNLKKAMKLDLYKRNREWPYKNVSKRIIAEEFLEDKSTKELRDYKFFCFNGKVICFKIDFNRYTNHSANYYDRELFLLPFGEVVCPPVYNQLIEIPSNFDDMMRLAEILSKDIPFLRVDLYNSNGKIYLGELTFFPNAGFGKFEPDEWDEKLGEMIKLPVIN